MFGKFKLSHRRICVAVLTLASAAPAFAQGSSSSNNGWLGIISHLIQLAEHGRWGELFSEVGFLIVFFGVIVGAFAVLAWLFKPIERMVEREREKEKARRLGDGVVDPPGKSTFPANGILLIRGIKSALGPRTEELKASGSTEVPKVIADPREIARKTTDARAETATGKPDGPEIASKATAPSTGKPPADRAIAHDVFISYSAKDRTIADAVCAALESEGVRCWIAPRDITFGTGWDESVIQAMERARIMVLVFTANANTSPGIRRQVAWASNHGVAILPLRTENVVPAQTLEYFIGSVHWLDAVTPPLEVHLKSLARNIKMMIGARAEADSKWTSREDLPAAPSVSPASTFFLRDETAIEGVKSPEIAQASSAKAAAESAGPNAIAKATGTDPAQSSVFISYRRQDSQHITGRIYDRLAAQFGKKLVFKDVDSIPLGKDFREHIREQVGRCAVLIAVIGKNWNPLAASGQPRLIDPRDHLRIEIESALERRIPVIPVLVDGVEMPSEDELPPSLANLAYYNGISIRPDPDFHHDADRLVRGIEQLLK